MALLLSGLEQQNGNYDGNSNNDKHNHFTLERRKKIRGRRI
jgi:hypothetical protein